MIFLKIIHQDFILGRILLGKKRILRILIIVNEIFEMFDFEKKVSWKSAKFDKRCKKMFWKTLKLDRNRWKMFSIWLEFSSRYLIFFTLFFVIIYTYLCNNYEILPNFNEVLLFLKYNIIFHETCLYFFHYHEFEKNYYFSTNSMIFLWLTFFWQRSYIFFSYEIWGMTWKRQVFQLQCEVCKLKGNF